MDRHEECDPKTTRPLPTNNEERSLKPKARLLLLNNPLRS